MDGISDGVVYIFSRSEKEFSFSIFILLSGP
jgi:hypothetical protein